MLTTIRDLLATFDQFTDVLLNNNNKKMSRIIAVTKIGHKSYKYLKGVIEQAPPGRSRSIVDPTFVPRLGWGQE